MTKTRINEIKSHFRLFAPKNIHKELAEVFKYIGALEKRCDDLEERVQGSLFSWQDAQAAYMQAQHAKALVQIEVDENE